MLLQRVCRRVCVCVFTFVYLLYVFDNEREPAKMQAKRVPNYLAFDDIDTAMSLN